MKILIVILLLLVSGCRTFIPSEPLLIGVLTNEDIKTQIDYHNLLITYDRNINLIYLNNMPLDSAYYMLELIDGLIIGEGPDIDSNFNAKNLQTMPNSREKHEYILLKRAIKLELPILAYERGFLMLNLVGGGEIYYDNKIFTKHSKVLHSLPNDESLHNILIAQNSLLINIMKKYDGYVNSSHTQAIKKLPQHFYANAIADDKLIEAISFKDYENLPFLIGIQWNPRELPNYNPFSYKIIKEFISSSEDYSKLNIP